MKRIFLLFGILLLLCSSLPSSAQTPPTEMADTMRTNGRIYVVIAVMLTILAGLIMYLIRLDRKIGRLEKEK